MRCIMLDTAAVSCIPETCVRGGVLLNDLKDITMNLHPHAFGTWVSEFVFVERPG